MKEWIEPPEIRVPRPLETAIGGHPLVARTLAQRGFTDVQAARAFVDPDCYRPAPPSDLPNMGKAARRLETAIRQRETICVWGDFDVDGQTATTLLVCTLRDLGAVVQHHIPNRERESHGINLPVLKRLIHNGVGLLLTCDTGVTAHKAIAYARGRGMEVVVTDHHDLPPRLPEAHAVVNPKMLPHAHPLHELPGVGCAYKLVEALYDRAAPRKDGPASKLGSPKSEPVEYAAQYLDLVALGIVADVAVQTGDTRYLLQRGLEALRHTGRLGLQVMMQTAEINPDSVTEDQIGFVLAPRLNALGRLADANVAVEFLTTDDLVRARILATELEGLNARRRLLCNQVIQAAESQIQRDPSLLEEAALVLCHPSWPAGVIGIVAGRLAERYQRPTVLIATAPGELARGSARSVEGCNVTAAIAEQGEMLESFGGHPMAAGLTIETERIPQFRRALSRTVQKTLGEVNDTATLQIDGYVSLADLTLDLVEELERLAPFGPGNPPLILASRELSLTSDTRVGRSGKHRQLTVEDDEGTIQKAIWWEGAGAPLPQGRFDLAYILRTTDYGGQRDVQVEWVDARPTEEPAVPLRREPQAPEVVDYRRSPNPRRLLERLRAQENIRIWSEAGTRAEVAGQDRYELSPSRALVIWSTPPGPEELQAVLQRVSPETVYLFSIDPGLDRPQKFLKRLAGLTKRALDSGGARFNVSTVAAATGQRDATVRAGIAWLAAHGDLLLADEEGDKMHLAPGSQTAAAELPEIAAQLRALLEETTAYRTHFTRADKDTLT